MDQNKLKNLRQEILNTEFSNMNESQREAIFAEDGPLLILAGAGTGKTTVVINKIAYLMKYGNVYHHDKFHSLPTDDEINFLDKIKNDKSEIEKNSELLKRVLSYNPIAPYRILAITFTNKAAGELKDRLAGKLGEEVSSQIWAGTFHGICGRILRRYADRIGYNSNFDIYDTNDQKKNIKDCLKAKKLDGVLKPFEVLSVISKAKDNLVSPDEFETKFVDENSDYQNTMITYVAPIYKMYQDKLKKSNAMDFDDMIMLTVKLLKENKDVLEYYSNKFIHIFIDEYQDTNHSQYELAFLLSSQHKNISVVGDDDQSIYKFRGAVIENILNFENQFERAKKIKLERNYRSVKNILEAANSLISKNEKRHDKKLWTSFDEGDLITYKTLYDEEDEASYICDTVEYLMNSGKSANDIAVFYRINAQSRAIEQEFIRRGIPYKIVGGHKFYERKEVKDITSYLSVITNIDDDTRLERIVNLPKRGIGLTTVKKIQSAATIGETSMFRVMEQLDSPNIKQFVDLIHSLQKDYENLGLDEFYESVLEKTGYLKMLKEKEENFEERLENIQELKSSIVRYFEDNDEEADLSSFLREVALLSDIDSFNETEEEVVLMTFHASKGLEFDTVFMTGMENNLFPGEKNMYTPEGREEERRLAYVGITRAKKNLYMTNAKTRMTYGKTVSTTPSIFISEINPKLILDISKDTSDFTNYNKSENIPSMFEVPKFKKSYNVKNKSDKNIKYSVGETVRHNTFGEGVILSVIDMGNDSLLEIAFDRVGTKKIMANYARLEKL